MPQTVGVAPGTITMCLGCMGDPSQSKQLVIMNPYVGGQVQLGAIPKARIRWDLIGLMGGGSLLVALTAGLIASALE
jgi:hypothetical protein